MIFPKFILKKDWFIETDFLGIKNKQLIYNKDQVFESNEKGEYHIIYGGWSEENTKVGGRMILDEEKMRLANYGDELLFQVIDESPDFEIIIEEIPEDDDILVRNWRIQLDVKTTRKKLKEVQQLIEEHIKPIL
jgi:hypothetical protein